MRDRVPRGFDPAGEVDRFLGVAAAVALGARGIQRQPDELLMGEFRLAGFIGGLDFLCPLIAVLHITINDYLLTINP